MYNIKKKVMGEEEIVKPITEWSAFQDNFTQYEHLLGVSDERWAYHQGSGWLGISHHDVPSLLELLMYPPARRWKAYYEFFHTINALTAYDASTVVGALLRIIRHREFDGDQLAKSFATLAKSGRGMVLLAMTLLQSHPVIRGKTTSASNFRAELVDTESIPVVNRLAINAGAYMISPVPGGAYRHSDFTYLLEKVDPDSLAKYIEFLLRTDHPIMITQRRLLDTAGMDINVMNELAQTQGGGKLLTAMWKYRKWELSENLAPETSAKLKEVMMGWELPREFVDPRTYSSDDEGDIDDSSDDEDDSSDSWSSSDDEGDIDDGTANYGMWKASGIATNIDKLVAACQPVLTGKWGADSTTEIEVLWLGWKYRTLVTKSEYKRELKISVESRDNGGCKSCLVMTVRRATSQMNTAHLDYLNYCFGKRANDKCFDPSATGGRSKVIMALVDLVNRICKVHYCTAEDAQHFKRKYYPGSVHTMLKKNSTFYEPFGFIFAPRSGPTALDMDGLQENLHTHDDVKVLFHTIMGKTAADVRSYLASGMNVKRALDTSTAGGGERMYTVLVPSHARRNVFAGTWYMSTDMSVPDISVGNLEFDTDAIIFENAQMNIGIRALRDTFRGVPVFIDPQGLAEPVSLVQCENRESDLIEKRSLRIRAIMKRLFERCKIELQRITADEPTLTLMQVLEGFENRDLKNILGVIFQDTPIVKYYRSGNDYVVKGVHSYKVAKIDNQCLAIASARKRLKIVR